jgi:hypothetical protein
VAGLIGTIFVFCAGMLFLQRQRNKAHAPVKAMAPNCATSRKPPPT